MTKPAVKITAIVGALILLATAYFHMTAMPQLKGLVTAIDSDFYRKGLPAMWMLPSVHWLFIACLSVGLSRYQSKACAAVLMAFGVWVLVDALITALHIGPFIGVYMLAAAGLLLLASGVMLRRG